MLIAFFALIVPLFLLGGISILFAIGAANNSNLMYIGMLFPQAMMISAISLAIGLFFLILKAFSYKPQPEEQTENSPNELIDQDQPKNSED